MSAAVLPLSFDRPITEAALGVWLSRATPGERIVYWRGYLARDTWVTRGGLSDIERRRLGMVARRAWLMSADGQVHLVQQRVAPGVFDYIAIARPHKQPRRRLDAPITVISEAA